MSDSILVRITLDSYDMASTGRQTQVYVQIPEVASASWLLSSDLFHRLKDRPWPEVMDVVRDYVTYGGLASNSSATAAWAAVMEWLRDPANRDEMQAAWEADQEQRHPVARKLRARVAELEAELAKYVGHEPTVAEEMAYLKERSAELEALELGAVNGRTSASCGNPDHPTWLRKLDDKRGCPWCRIAEMGGAA
ncbi:hypothetical protein ACGFZR_24590 [Streptomyces sp. NPDC048241]|uniref:hypothetical protein n=1 Tax=Streptomyces sp. NPDC048241 TaxID=3365521 RepID=UPI0037238FE8